MNELPFLFRLMDLRDIDRVVAIENCSQVHPWTKQNFKDCIDSKYWNYVLLDEAQSSQIVGFCIVMPGVDELHLLNISIDRAYRRRHIAKRALESIESSGKEHGFSKILLEVRRSNLSAITLYEQLNYILIGTRKNYYPLALEQSSLREDALILEKVLK